MASVGEIGAVILAGGLSRRMGRHKALLLARICRGARSSLCFARFLQGISQGADYCYIELFFGTTVANRSGTQRPEGQPELPERSGGVANRCYNDPDKAP